MARRREGGVDGRVARAGVALYTTDLAYVHDAAFGDLARAAAPAIVRTLRAHGIARGRIVELGCGSGVAARHFVECGYHVTGIDVSKAMIRLARAAAPGASFRAASLARVRIPRCDAIVGIGEVFNYLPGGAAALARFFDRAHVALAPRGCLIFDFMESGARRTYPAKSQTGHDWAIASRARLDRSRRVLTRQIVVIRKVGRRVRRTSETHTIRIYTRRAVREALVRAGFSVRMSRSFGRHRVLPGDVVVVARIA